jgi:hypothetical protein
MWRFIWRKKENINSISKKIKYGKGVPEAEK